MGERTGTSGSGEESGKVEWVIDRDVGYLAELDSASLF